MAVLECGHRGRETKGIAMFQVNTFLSIAKAMLTKKSPFYIQYYINGKCNLSCKQCNIVETNSKVAELGLDGIAKLAQNIKKIGGGIVLLTGGEPFMRKDLPEIVDIFVKTGLNIRLQTAGTRFATKQKLQACYDAGARDINVSLDSLEMNKFDYINSVPGSAQNAINTIETISHVFREASILSFGTVLSRYNYREIPAILEFARRIGWWVSLVPVHIADRAKPKGFQSFASDFTFQSTHHPLLDQLADELTTLKKNRYPLFDSERFIRSSMSMLKGEGPTWRHKGVCDSPGLYFAIRPDGAFTTCCDYTLEAPPYVQSDQFVRDYRLGNIANRHDVQRIVRNCDGCHYGSYPEITLSVRNLNVFVERAKVSLVSGFHLRKSKAITENFLAEAAEVRSAFPQIYPSSQWMDQDLIDTVDSWVEKIKNKRQNNPQLKSSEQYGS
jgi:MoaA/NifB/PqqE/SkfB family radical SAM enzyme